MKDIEDLAAALADLAMKCAGRDPERAVRWLLDAATCLNAAAGGDITKMQAYFDNSTDAAAESAMGGNL